VGAALAREVRVNIRSLTRGPLSYQGEVEGKRQTYYVFEAGRYYLIMSLSRSKPNAGNFNVVDVDGAAYVARRFAGRKGITATEVAKASRTPKGGATPLEALNILYVLVATNRAKIDTRFHDRRLYFNVMG
jgi:hypothetical protein